MAHPPDGLARYSPVFQVYCMFGTEAHFRLEHRHENQESLSRKYLARSLQQCWLTLQPLSSLLNLPICGLFAARIGFVFLQVYTI